LHFQGDAVMSPQAEETVKASLTRINAGLQGAGLQEVFEQYEKGVYLKKPFRLSEHAYEVARALGGEQEYATVERDQDPNQNDQFWVRLLKPNEITNLMVSDATGVTDQMRKLEPETQQEPEAAEPWSPDASTATPTQEDVNTAWIETQGEPEPAEPQFRHVSAVTPTEEVMSTTFLEEIELTEKSAHLPGYAYAGGQQLNTIFEVGDGGPTKAVAINGIRGQRDAMLELHSDGLIEIHVDAADAMGGINDYTRYMTTRNDQDLFQPGGPLVVEFTKEELAQVASISTMDAGQFGRRTVITYNDSRSLNVMAGDVQIALKTGTGEITKPVTASVGALSTLARIQGERIERTGAVI
jgi:hypothetical protein